MLLLDLGGDVAEHVEQQRLAAGAVRRQQRGVGLEPHPAVPVLVFQPPADRLAAASPGQAPEHPFYGPDIVWMGQVGRPPADQLFGRVAGDALARGGDKGGDAGEVGGDDDVGDVLGHQLIAPLGLPAGRQVLGLGDEVLGPAVVLAHHGDREADPHRCAVGAAVALVHLVAGDLAGHEAGQQVEVGLKVVRMGDGLEVQLQHPWLVIVEQFAEGGVDLEEAPFQSHQGHADRGVMEGVLEQQGLSLALADVLHQRGPLPAVRPLYGADRDLDREQFAGLAYGGGLYAVIQRRFT